MDRSGPRPRRHRTLARRDDGIPRRRARRHPRAVRLTYYQRMKRDARRRVVVTGLGMITPLGTSVEKTWEGIVAGRSGIGPITRFDPTGLETTIAGEVRDFDPTAYMDRKEVRRADRFAQMAVATAGQALQNANLEITPNNAPHVGVAFGSGIGGVSTLVDNIFAHANAPKRVSAFLIPMMIVDMAAGEIASEYGAH